MAKPKFNSSKAYGIDCKATTAETKEEAEKIAAYLKNIGYSVEVEEVIYNGKFIWFSVIGRKQMPKRDPENWNKAIIGNAAGFGSNW